MKLKAVIIGAGNIGCTFDTPDSINVLTHAHALTKIENVDLVGFMDTNLAAAQKAATMWSGKAYNNLSQMLSEIRPDIISICSPNKFHYEHLKTVLEFDPKIVLTEKPLTTDIKQSEEVITLYDKKNIFCSVNYIRRFIPSYQELKKRITSEEFGNIISANGYYGKGLLHNGSHLIDLINFLNLRLKNLKLYTPM